MKISFNFEKKHFYTFLTIIIIFSTIVFVKGLVTNNIPWHPLQEVSTDNSGSSSVDADVNGIIDIADDVLIAQDTNSIKGRSIYWDSIDANKLCYNTAGTCTTTSATCLSGSSSITTNGDSCPDCDCNLACRNTVRCEGNTAECSGTQIFYSSGSCSKYVGSGRCLCNCILGSNSQYQQGTLTGTKKCSTFVDSP